MVMRWLLEGVEGGMVWMWRKGGKKGGGEGRLGWEGGGCQVFRTVGACETYLGQVSNVVSEKSAGVLLRICEST